MEGLTRTMAYNTKWRDVTEEISKYNILKSFELLQFFTELKIVFCCCVSSFEHLIISNSPEFQRKTFMLISHGTSIQSKKDNNSNSK